MVLHAVVFPVASGLEGKGQGENLSVNWLPIAAGFGDHVNSVLGRHMDEIHASAGAFGHAGNVPKSQVFNCLGVNQVGVVPVPLIPLLSHEVVVHHQLVVFTVDCEHAAMAGHLLHQVIEPAGFQASTWGQCAALVAGGTDIGGEDLYAGETGRDQLSEPGDGVGSIGIPVDDVGGVVGVGLALPDRHEVMDPLGQVALVVHWCEVDHSGGAAPDGPQGMYCRASVWSSGD